MFSVFYKRQQYGPEKEKTKKTYICSFMNGNNLFQCKPQFDLELGFSEFCWGDVFVVVLEQVLIQRGSFLTQIIIGITPVKQNSKCRFQCTNREKQKKNCSSTDLFWNLTCLDIDHTGNCKSVTVQLHCQTHCELP